MTNKTLYYWHPTSKTVSKVPGTWAEDIRAAQINLLTGQGFLPVPDYKPLRTQMPFARVYERFWISDDEKSAVQEIVEEPRPVRLSREKLVAHPAIQSALRTMADALTSDAELASWWTGEAVYLRGSPVAERAMSVFVMTQEQMEKIVLECMA